MKVTRSPYSLKISGDRVWCIRGQKGDSKSAKLLDTHLAAINVHRHCVITRPVGAGSDRPDRYFHLGGNSIESAPLVLDFASHIGRCGLSNTTQTNQKQDEQRTSN